MYAMMETIKQFRAFLNTPENVAFKNIVTVAAVIAATFLLIQVLHWIVNLLMKRKKKLNKRVNTLRKLLNSIITYVAVIFAIVQIVQSVFQVNLGAIMAAAGILGVAVGFGAQTLVKDVIAGFFILLEGQYSVGDQITVSGASVNFSGVVDELGLRSTRIRGQNGDLFIVPNGSIGSLINHSLLPHSFFISCIFPPDTDGNAMLAVFDRIGKKAEEDLSPLTKTPVPSLCPAPKGTGFSIRLKVVCQPQSRELLEKELLHRLHRGLAKEGVKIPAEGLEIIRE